MSYPGSWAAGNRAHVCNVHPHGRSNRLVPSPQQFPLLEVRKRVQVPSTQGSVLFVRHTGKMGASSADTLGMFMERTPELNASTAAACAPEAGSAGGSSNSSHPVHSLAQRGNREWALACAAHSFHTQRGCKHASSNRAPQNPVPKQQGETQGTRQGVKRNPPAPQWRRGPAMRSGLCFIRLWTGCFRSKCTSLANSPFSSRLGTRVWNQGRWRPRMCIRVQALHKSRARVTAPPVPTETLLGQFHPRLMRNLHNESLMRTHSAPSAP